jgi:hypothetical protein
MKNKIGSEFIFLLITMYFLASCVPNSAVPVERPTLTPDPKQLEVEIYELVISELYPEGKVFFVFDETESYGSSLIDELEGVSVETRDDFDSKNKYPDPINPSLKSDSKFIFTSLGALQRQYEIDDPQIIYELDFVTIREDYPDVAGILEFSRVGFDSTFDQALVDITYADIYSGSRMDFTVVLLSRTDDSWQIIDIYDVYEEG